MPGFNNLNAMDSSPYDGFFLATVVENNDPNKRQRIKVRISNLLEGEPDSLPWLAPLQDPGFGTGTAYGKVSVPRLGSVVVVIFQNSDPHYGLYLGTLHHSNFSLPSELQTNYPDRYGFKDIAGNFFFVDQTEGSVDVRFQHKSGTSILIDDQGNVTVNAVKNSSVSIAENSTVSVGQNSNVSIEGNSDLSVQGNLSATIQGSVNLTAQGSITSSAPSWSHSGNISVTGNLNVTGTMNSTGTIQSQDSVIGIVDVSGGGKSLALHRHIGVRGGSDVSGPPQ
jgi:uncharacterized protein involved in type VI secretion and phage assembly